MDFNNGLIIAFLKRAALEEDKTTTITYPCTFQNKIVGIWDSALRYQTNTGKVRANGTPDLDSITLSSCVILQDTYTDSGGFDLIIGY